MTETVTAPLHRPIEGVDRFIPVRKSDILATLLRQGAFKNDDERDKFGRLCEMLEAIAHYYYFRRLERLRGDYYYFNPEIAPHAALDRAARDQAYAELKRSLDEVLEEANFSEIPHADIREAHRRRDGLRVKIAAPLQDFREVRFWRRGHHTEPFDIVSWYGLSRRTVVAEVYDDVVLMVAMKTPDEINSPSELRRLTRGKIVPGSVLLKYFRNMPSSALNALFPNARVVMSNQDKLTLGLPALAGGVPILLKIYATITVLFLVIGFYLGKNPSVEQRDMATALAALGGLVAFGGFVVQQWVKYQARSLRHQIELTANVYFRNVNNNSGIFDSLIGAAEDQQSKEIFLAYYFLHAAPQPLTATELDGRVEAWLQESFGLKVNFAAGDAFEKLERLGLLQRRQERLFVSPLDGAIAQLREIWAKFLSPGPQAADK
jgi:Protein of unknown function (DUF3754)